MDKIIDYKIVKSVDVDVVVDRVKQNLKNGWQPYGDMVKGTYHSHYLYFQPMVKYEESDEITDDERLKLILNMWDREST